MLLHRIQGCLIGLAVGDALGVPVEFINSIGEIRRKYGEDGIADFAPWGGFPAGCYTDDTQMSLATSKGIIRALKAEAGRELKRQKKNDSNADFKRLLIQSVYEEYRLWHETQKDPHERRAPGYTCLNALGSGKMGTMECPLNDSKGCGGVMRTAPVGLVLSGPQAFRIGADCAAMTHGHPSGFLPAGFIAELVSYLIEEKSLKDSIEICIKTLKSYSGHEETLFAISKAVELAGKGESPMEAIPRIGDGWTGEEALGIALFCALEFESDFRSGVLAAVNHGGDSDSTGSIAGVILGAKLGLVAIPKNWVSRLENSDNILQIAHLLFQNRIER